MRVRFGGRYGNALAWISLPVDIDPGIDPYLHFDIAPTQALRCALFKLVADT